ncbi:dipeptidyl aminopeptidase/acylaminoacyl peptidase [Chitinivorax tropicus]|uniref:Dipeptidyl aminopeptidase/acylaminoacyl peptidase n=1 Tax=Chitinivorax tropicus TaxID=714531 RepID=A0A840MEU0_9PROT|nr:prolyl oligopeptidase family serine peptidase [Chitinivorax tropicus]MBB5017198.1 dipeptidyl aminopeptidase/acylaminoacyl peptidase [Chitinivorax tropicus]
MKFAVRTIWPLLTSLLANPLLADGYTGLGADSVAKETIEQFRPKPLDANLSRRIQNMLDISSPGAGMLTSDGKRLYFSWRVTGVSQVWRLDGPQHFPVQMTGGEDATQLVGITADDRFLIISRDRKGEENPGLYLQPADGGPLMEIQHKPGVQTQFQFASKDGRFIYYRSNDQRTDSYAIYRYSIASGEKEQILNEPGLWLIADHQSDGRMLLEKSLSNVITEYFEYQPQTKQLLPLFGQGEKAEFAARYGGKAGELIVLTSKFGDFRRLYRWKAGQFTPLSPEIKWDISHFSLDKARQHLTYTTNEGGYTRLTALDASTFTPLKLPVFKDVDHVTAGSHSVDGRYSVLTVEKATMPKVSYVYEWKTGKLTQWQQPMTPEVETRHFANASLESYPARDGTPIPMFVRRPAQCKPGPCPVVVYFHGGPEGQTTAGFSTYAQLFVDAGFIFAAPNVRGSDGYGKSWLAMDDGPKRLNVITDIEDAARYIRANWGKDGKAPKIGIMGGSYGGYATLIGMTLFAGAYDAGVSSVGISNLMTFLQNTASYRRQLRIAEYGNPDTDKDALVQLSPINHVEKLKAPLMIVQGVSDPRVPVGEAVQMYEAAKKRNVPAELILLSDEGHGVQKRENRVAVMGHTLRFMETYLKPAN